MSFKENELQVDASSNYLDDEAEVDGPVYSSNQEESSENGNDDESDSGIDHYEQDMLIVNDGSDLEDADTVIHRKRLRRGKRKVAQLDEEDYQLIEENMNIEGDMDMGMAMYPFKTDITKQPRLDVIDKAKLEKELFDDEAQGDESSKTPSPQPTHTHLRDDEFDSEEDFVVEEDEEDQIDPSYYNKKHVRDASDAEQYSYTKDIYHNSEYGVEGDSEWDDLYYAPEGAGALPTDKFEALKKLGFEPVLLEENYLTPEDEKIVKIDIPERLQLRFPNRPDPTDEEIKSEAKWIYQNMFLFGPSSDPHPFEITTSKIENILKMLLQDKLEIPFISTYRKESWHPEIERKHLWTIYSWDQKWFYREARKLNLKELLVSAQSNAEISSACSNLLIRLDMAQNDETIDDIRNYFTLHYGIDSVCGNTEKPKYKLPQRNTLYYHAKTCVLEKLFVQFGISPQQLAKELADQYMNPLTDPTTTPEEEAQQYTSPMFTTVSAVLEGARHIFARELSAELYIRRTIRDLYHQYATVSTQPTENAKNVIDVFHRYRSVRRLVQKPVLAFRNDQFLLLAQAVKDNLVTMTIEVPEQKLPEFINRIYKAFYSLPVSDDYASNNISRLWNEQRQLIIFEMLQRFLFPLFYANISKKLRREAEDYVAEQCAQKLESMLISGPYVPTDNYVEWYRKNHRPHARGKEKTPPPITVMSFCTEENVGEYVILDNDGELVDTLSTSSFVRFEDRKVIEDFILRYSPTVVVVGADGFRAYHNHNVLDDIIYSLSQQENFPPIQVTFKSCSVARIYQSSLRAQREFPDVSLTSRRAISIGRSLLDPLIELCGLREDNKSILSLNLHPLRNAMDPEILFEKLDQCFINVVNAVGININQLISHSWMRPILKYCCGLGPRKSIALFSHLSKMRVDSRMQLRDEQQYLGPCVWKNAAGFIKIARILTEDGLRPPSEVLDLTRIHPDHYSLARKIARDAIRSKDERQDYVLALMRDPKKLETIDIELFAKLLEERGQSKRFTLQDIKNELNNPFVECREPYRNPSKEELFDLLTGDVLIVGMPQTVRVEKIQKANDPATNRPTGYLKVKLECGLPGRIELHDVTDKPFDRIWNIVKKNDRLKARIKSINKNEFLCTLTARESELSSSLLDPPRPDDPYLEECYEELNSTPDNEGAHSLKHNQMHLENSDSNPIVPRSIIHPNFQNLDLKGVQNFLEEKPPGFYVISPCGPDHLTITMKFFFNLLVHIDVVEENKENVNMLGEKLRLGHSTFTALDDLIVNYMDPLWMNAIDMTKFKKFRELPRSQIEQLILEEKGAQPTSAPYYIAPSEEHPGRFVLYYCPGTSSVYREYISPVPEGLRFRQKVHPTPHALIAWFKKHFREHIPSKTRHNNGVIPRYDADQNPHHSALPTTNYNPSSGYNQSVRNGREVERESGEHSYYYMNYHNYDHDQRAQTSYSSLPQQQPYPAPYSSQGWISSHGDNGGHGNRSTNDTYNWNGLEIPPYMHGAPPPINSYGGNEVGDRYYPPLPVHEYGNGQTDFRGRDRYSNTGDKYHMDWSHRRA